MPAPDDVVHDAPATDVAPAQTPAQSGTDAAQSGTAADRFMRKLLRVTEVQRSARTEREAHRSFRTSMIVSGVRCLISYLIVPILVPIIGFAGIVAAPIGIALCIVAAVNGVYAVRRFWISNHRMRWMYTWFIAVVFVVLIVMVASDISRIVGAL